MLVTDVQETCASFLYKFLVRESPTLGRVASTSFNVKGYSTPLQNNGVNQPLTISDVGATHSYCLLRCPWQPIAVTLATKTE